MPRIKRPRKIGRYTNEFKVRAVRLTFIEGTQIREVANALDIHPLHVVTLAQGIPGGGRSAHQKDLRRRSRLDHEKLKALEQENAKLRVENDLLKIAIRFSSEKKAEVFESIERPPYSMV